MSDVVKAALTQLPILPGEYLPGYLARLRQTLFFVDNADFFRITKGVKLGKLDKLFPKVALRFAYLNLKQGQRGKLLHHHLGARYWRGYIDESKLDEHIHNETINNKSTRSVFRGEELMGDLLKPRFCSACVESDKQLYGVALWKANHQLPSVYVCSEHRTPLKWFEIDRLSTLLDYPTPQYIPNKAIHIPELLPSLEDITDKSIFFLNQKTEENREIIKDIRSDMVIGLDASTNGRRVSVKLDVVKEWRRYLGKRLDEIDPIQQGRSSVKVLQKFHPNEILNESSLTHPMLFLLLLQFTELYTGKRSI
tara:strand:- start:1018 stop:1944 length:927 start_codon:yes stop_codon:yes gene_type:complete